jgi:UDP-N-acetylglucosamine:LPS N-acetylglucosamine transferase
MINQLSHYNGTAVMVRGLPDASRLIPSTNDIQFYNHLPTDQYVDEIAKAEYVISRSGYSTVMDLAVMKKKSILIATPGQTEQEYLSQYLEERKIAVSIDQKEFKLSAALKKAASFPFCKLENTGNKLSAIIAAFLSTLKAG